MLKKQTSRIRKVHIIITSKSEEILQDKMRLTAATFALTLVVLSLSCICLISSVSASPVAKIEVSSTTPAAYESLTVLNPGAGNWIELIGGNEELNLPTIQLVYSIGSTEYTRGNKDIKITSNMGADYIVNYPFQNHPLYYDDVVTVNVQGESSIAGEKVYICLMSPNEANSLWNSIFDGDLKSIRVLRDNTVKRETTLNSAGDCTVSFGTLNPGDYVVSAFLDTSSAQNMTFIFTSLFEVFEHKSSLEPETSTITRTSASDYRFASGKYNLIGADAGATYNYVVALIRKDEQFDLRWDCYGTNSELNLKVSNAPLAKSINVFGGMGLGQLTLGIIYDWILTFQTASVEKGASGTTYEFSLPVMDMPDGDYYLYAMASTSPSGKAFASALAQESVEIKTLVKQKLTISLTANPELIEANGVDKSTITAKVTDEFGKGISGIKVSFSTTLGTIDSPKTTTDEGIATTILTSYTSRGTAVVEGNVIIDDIPIYDTALVAFMKTSECGCSNETLGDITVTVEDAITRTTVSVTNTIVTVKEGVITIKTTVESAIEIADNAPAGSVVSLPIENGILEITLEEDAAAVDNVVIGNIRKIRLNTPSEEYITSRPEVVGTASIDLDVDFRRTATPCKKLSCKITLQEKYEDLPVPNPDRIEDTLAAYFDVDTSTIADSTPILVHAELSGIAPPDITGVPISITVNTDWYDTVARGNKNNVLLFKISDEGKVEEAKSPEEVIIDSVNDRVTFLTTFDLLCVFAIVARPPEAAAPPPTPTPYRVVSVVGGGGVGIIGPTLVSELRPIPIPAPPALIISNVSVTIDEDSVFITWETTERSDSRVKCGIKSGQYTIEEYAPQYVLQHAIPLKQIQLKNIFENTTYYFIVNSTGPSGNSAQTDEYMFILTPPEPKGEIIPFILQLPQTVYPHMWWISLAIIIVLIVILLTLPRRKSRRTFNSLIEKPVGTEVLMYLFRTFPKVSGPADISKQINVDLNGVLEALHTLSNKNMIESSLGIGLVDKVEREGETCYGISKRAKSLMEALK